MTKIVASQIFDGSQSAGPRLIILEGALIAAIEPMPRAVPPDAICLPDTIMLAPGLIDIQVNGGGGAFLNATPTLAAIRTMTAAHRRYGTTGMFPTLITDAPAVMRALSGIAPQAMSIPGVLGFHLEGPFLNPARKGIHPANHLRQPDADDRALLETFAATGHSLITLAPEIACDDFIAACIASGLRVALGHSDATCHESERAFAAGATGITHLFNAMSQMMPRSPGLVGAALAADTIVAGMICDGLHVDPANLRVAFKALGRERLMIVTDAMPTAASPIQEFLIGDKRITLHDGKLTGPDGTLAGAHITMIESVCNAVAMMGCTLDDALVMASRTPASFLGLEKSHGRIAPGYRADMIAFTPDFRVTDSWIGGMRENYA